MNALKFHLCFQLAWLSLLQPWFWLVRLGQLRPCRHHCLTRLRFPGRRPPCEDRLGAPAAEHSSKNSGMHKQACF